MKKRSFADTDKRRDAMYSRVRGGARYGKLAQSRARKVVASKILKSFGIVCASVFAVLFVYVGIIQGKLGTGLDGNLFAALTSVGKGDPFYMLLMGIDKDEERVNSAAYGPSDSAYRTDSIILARVAPKDDQVTLISIHRDTMVDMGTHGKQKINAAYSFGGPAYAVQVVSDYAGVPISHYAEMDFEGFTKVIDTLGGIEVNVPIDINDSLAGAHLKAGEQTLNSTQALALCRARHAYDSYGPGDAYRAANQRMVISAIVKKLFQADAATITASISELADCITTDMSLTDILGLAAEMRDMDVDNNIYTGQDPTTSQYINSLWFEVCDKDAWKKMMQRVNAGLSPYESVEEDPTHNGAGGKINIKNDDSNSGSDTENSSRVTGSVEVLNATTSAGLAGRVAKSLESLGANSTKVGNANHQYATSLIVYTNDANKAKAEAIAQALGGQIQVISGGGQYSTTCDVLVILGSDMKDVD